MTGRALPARPWPGGPERQRLPRSPSLHGPASRGAPSHRRLPDRLHYRHPEPEKNAIAGRIHARGACARSRREPVRRRSGAIAAPQGPATSIAAPSSRQSSALNGAPEPDVPPDASVAPSVAVAVRRHGPVGPRREGLNLRLVLADEEKRHRLHPPRRPAARQLAPETATPRGGRAEGTGERP